MINALLLFIGISNLFSSGGAFKCWCENTVNCSSKKEMECPQINQFDKIRSCVKIYRDTGEVIRACGGALDRDLCMSNRNIGVITCSCPTEMCNNANNFHQFRENKILFISMMIFMFSIISL